MIKKSITQKQSNMVNCENFLINKSKTSSSGLDQDDSEIESSDDTRKKYDSTMLLRIFGDMKSVEHISFVFAQEIYKLSPLAGYEYSSNFAHALRIFEEIATREDTVQGIDPDEILQSTGKAIKDTLPGDVKQILNNTNDAWAYFDYVMQNKDVRDAMIEKTFPGIVVNTLEYHNAGEDTISDDKSLKDFRKKTNVFVRLAIRTTPFFSFSMDENGNLVKGEASGFVDFEDLQNALMLAGIDIRKNGNEFREDGLGALIDKLTAMAHQNGIDSRRGRNILSFVNRLTSLDSNPGGITDLLKNSKDPKQIKFMNEFLNGFLSTYLSLYQKEISDFSVQGFEKNKLRIKKLVFEGSNENKFKTRLKNNIRSFVMDENSQVKESVYKNLNWQFKIDESGLKLSDGTRLIRREGEQYVFEDHKDLTIITRSIMSHLGLSIFPKRGLNIMMRNNKMYLPKRFNDRHLTKQKSPYNHISDLITKVNDNKVGSMTPRDFMADNLMKMILSINHNQDFYQKVKAASKDLPKGQDLRAKDLNNIFKNSDHHKILNYSLRNVDKAIEGEDFPRELNYKVFKPTDFYKFFQVLGEVKAQTTTFGGVNFFYRPDGKKEYLYGLSSGFFEHFADGISKTKSILSANGVKSKNLLLADYSPYTVINIEEVKGIKQSDINKGMVKPNTSDLLTIGLNLFLDSLTSGETKLKMTFMNTNISDSGYMYATTYGVSKAQQLFLRGVHDNSLVKAKVNNDAINNALRSVYGKFVEEHQSSVDRWKVIFGQAENTTGELLPREAFLAMEQGNKTQIDPKQPITAELTRINELFRSYDEASAEQLRRVVMGSDLVLNRDYVIKNSHIQFGKATSGNIDLETGQGYSIYNLNDANQFLSLSGDQLSKFRRKVFGKEYFNFVNMMNKHDAKVSKDYQMPLVDGHGFIGNGYALGQTVDENEDSNDTRSGDWNPILESYFMGYHIMNTSFNELWLGSQFQYGGLSTADMSKCSKPYTTPGITAGRIDPLSDPDGMGTKTQVVVITDEIIKGMGFAESVYNTELVATDGIGWANPLFCRFMDHSFGGRFSTMDKGMRKPLTSYNDPVTGTSIQIKQAEHVLSYDVFSNSIVAERMFKEMLEMTEAGLSDVFMEAFEAAGGHDAGSIAWEHALTDTSQYVKDNFLHNKLVWQFITPSAIKTGLRRVNKYSMEEGFANGDQVSSIEIDTHEIRMVLNPYQDFNDNERMAPPTQMLAIMGIGQQNSEKIAKVNSNLSKIFDCAFSGVMKQLNKNPDEYISNILTRAIEAMPTFGNFAEMVTNPNISLNLPQLTEKAQQIISNNITKEGVKRKYAGLRASQAPGSILDVYEKDGQVYMLNDIRRAGGVSHVGGVTIVDPAYGKRKLKPMTKTDAAEIIVPFSYMAKFGVKPTDSLQDIYTIKLNSAVSGQTSFNFSVGGKVDLKGIKEFIQKNYDKIDMENTPLMRAMNSIVGRTNEGPVEENLSYGTIGAQIANLQKCQTLYDQMNQRVDYKAELLNNLDRVDNYYNALAESLNMFVVRIPTYKLGSGFRGRVVGFINDMGNTIYSSELKNLLDGSDYDIDQLSIFLKFVNSDFTMPKEGTIKSMQNEIVQTLMDIYKTESGNDEDIYNQLSLDKLSKLADDIDKKSVKVVNDPGHNADDYTLSVQGSDSINRFANLASVYAYISHLPIERLRQIIPWAADGMNNQKGGESIFYRLGLFLNASIQNEKLHINGRLGITKDSTNIVGVMLLSGYSEKQVAGFLQSDAIKKVYELVEKGMGVTESARDFDPYMQVNTMLKNIAFQMSKRRMNDGDLEFLKDQEETLITARDAYIQSSQYFDKLTKQVKYEQLLKDKEVAERFAEFNSQISEVSTNRKYLEDQAILKQFKKFLIQGESLKRIAHVVSLRKGFKAMCSDFDFYYNSLSSFLGMELRDFSEGQPWNESVHMAYFIQTNNAAAYGTKTESENAIEFERQVVMAVNLPGMVSGLPHFNSYVNGLGQLKSFFEDKFLLRSPVFEEWAEEYLSGQERTTFLSKSHRATFYSELGKFFLAVHFKDNFKSKKFDLGLHNSGVRHDSILKTIDISTPGGRNLYALQFPQFIIAMQHADNLDLFRVPNGRDYSAWFDFFKGNEFLERLGLNDNNESSCLVLEDSFNLTEHNVYKLRSEYEKLPLELREMLEINDLITNGFDAPGGSIKDVMGTSILEGVSKTLDKIQIEVNNNSSNVEKWRKSFLRALPHANEMSRYLSNKDRNKGSERATVLLTRGGEYFSKKKLKLHRKVSTGRYTEEYLCVGKLGIPYDPDLDMTTKFEPLLGLSSLELDNLMNKGKLVKNFVRPHNYLTKYNSQDSFYVLPNGWYVRLNMKESNKLTAVFVAVSPEKMLNLSDGIKVFDGNSRLKIKRNGKVVYTGKLTEEIVSSNPEGLFVLEGYGIIPKNNFAQRIALCAMENTFDFVVRKTQRGKFNFYCDELNGANPEFENLVDQQIARLKEKAGGREIVFPEKGFSKMSELENKMPFGFEYLTDRLSVEFGINYKLEMDCQNRRKWMS